VRFLEAGSVFLSGLACVVLLRVLSEIPVDLTGPIRTASST
jgi:hypothetical protein